MKHFIYHSKDLDGLTCGALALRYADKFDDLELVGYDYGEKLDLRQFAKSHVSMADVSVEPERMIQFANYVESFTWYDHHVSAYEKFLAYLDEKDIKYVFSRLGKIEFIEVPSAGIRYYYCPTMSGCEIYFHIEGKEENERFKQKIRALGQYDTWRNTNEKKTALDLDWNREVMPFQWGMRTAKTPEEVLHALNYRDFESVRLIGENILEYQKNQSFNLMKSNCFDFELNGLKIVACNGAQPNSSSFDGFYHDDYHDAMMPFNYNGKENLWSFSLYTTKPDVDILSIAKAFGGGGHAQACGFKIKATSDNIIPNFLQLNWNEIQNSKTEDDGK